MLEAATARLSSSSRALCCETEFAGSSTRQQLVDHLLSRLDCACSVFAVDFSLQPVRTATDATAASNNQMWNTLKKILPVYA
jgi:hypothetical protein